MLGLKGMRSYTNGQLTRLSKMLLLIISDSAVFKTDVFDDNCYSIVFTCRNVDRRLVMRSRILMFVTELVNGS